MTLYRADLAWVDGAVRERVGLEIDAEGRLAGVTPEAAEGQRIAGLVVPGIANLHCEAFLRAIAGLGEGPGAPADPDRPWRAARERLLAALTPDDVQAIAAQLYAECLMHGTTAVGAFHTLHNAPDGRPYGDPAEMALRLAAAAGQAGIGLTLLPVLQCRGGFGGAPPRPEQRRFILGAEAYGRLCEEVAEYVPVGVAVRSLAAVTPAELQAALVIADTLGPATKLHLRAAASGREVAACLAWSGRRPVEWLLAHAPVGARWCVVHATHATTAEAVSLAASGAVVGVCQTTEAHRGEGLFPLLPYRAAGGRFGIGSGANLSTSPVEELRWIDALRRLEARRPCAMTGLFEAAVAGGARALGRAPAGQEESGAIAPGRLADLVVLDPLHPALVGRHGTGLLDAWVFAANGNPVRHVMVAGRWMVQHGAHVRGDEIAVAFRRTMRRLGGVL